MKEHIFGATCTICGIQTGHTEAGVKTVLPSTALARLDFRLVPDLTPRPVLQLVREHLDVRGFKDIEIIELGKRAAGEVVGKFDGCSCRDWFGHGSLWRRAAGLSDGSFEWTGWAQFAASQRRRRRWHRSASAMQGQTRTGRMKTFASTIFCRASNLSGELFIRLGETKARTSGITKVSGAREGTHYGFAQLSVAALKQNNLED